jgi:hypothetical protein
MKNRNSRKCVRQHIYYIKEQSYNILKGSTADATDSFLPCYILAPKLISIPAKAYHIKE